MYGIYKIEIEWDSNLIECLRNWIEQVGVDKKKLISRHGTIEEAESALKLLDGKWKIDDYKDGRYFIRMYEILEVDT